ncbi:MAG: DUF6089 family protein [Saprospiraceae bacterium]
MTRFLLLLLLLLSNPIFSQKIELGIGVGTSTYWGDLNASDFSTNLKNSGLAIELTGRAIYNRYFGVRANIAYGRINGDDGRASNLWQRERNLSFSSHIFELAALGEFYFFEYDEESIFVPYIAAGISLFHFDPKTKFNGVEYRLQPLGTEGQGLPGYGKQYSLVSMSIPFGAGAKLKINDKINISFEILTHRTFTDYIDDVSTNYVNYNEFIANGKSLTANLANRMHEFRGTNELINLPTGTQRGGAKVNDYYFFTMAGIHFLVGNGFTSKKGYKSNCPKF